MPGFEIFTETQEEVKEIEVPIFKEIAIDFTNGEPIIKDNDFLIVEKTEALKVWIWKTLKTERKKYLIYSDNYGNDLIENIGQIYDKTTKDALMINEIRECLLVNPYILNAYNFNIKTKEEGRHPIISFNIDTIYGTTESEVNANIWSL